jgi:UMP-CMP kinase
MSYQDKYLKYKQKYLDLKSNNNIEILTGGGKKTKKTKKTNKTKTNTKRHTTKPEIIFLSGGPGCGKGTLSEKIAEKFKYKPISVGDLLREEKERPDSKNGKLIKEYMAEGKIIPYKITIELIKAKILELSSKGFNKFLLDGFPRNNENLEGWNEIVGDSIKLKFVIFLNCSEENMIKRVLKRGETSGRADDNIETLTKRIKVYNEQTLPVIEYYKKLNLVKEIDSNKTPEQIFNIVKKLFINNSNKYIIGVAGASGCGKTYFSNYLKELIEKDFSVEIISCDDYYKSYSEEKKPNGKWITPNDRDPDFNWDVPDVLDLKLLSDNLSDFKENIDISIPEYDFIESHRREKPKKIIKSKDIQIIIVEGLYVLYDEDLRSQFNLKIFIDADNEICLGRRIFRDIIEGRKLSINTSIEEKKKELEKLITVYKKNIRPSYIKYIDHTKEFADFIINSEINYKNTDTKTIDIILKEVTASIKK